MWWSHHIENLHQTSWSPFGFEVSKKSPVDDWSFSTFGTKSTWWIGFFCTHGGWPGRLKSGDWGLVSFVFGLFSVCPFGDCFTDSKCCSFTLANWLWKKTPWGRTRKCGARGTSNNSPPISLFHDQTMCVHVRTKKTHGGKKNWIEDFGLFLMRWIFYNFLVGGFNPFEKY